MRVVAYAEGAGREQGVVTKVKEGIAYAFIKCCDREEQLFFHASAFKELAPAVNSKIETRNTCKPKHEKDRKPKHETLNTKHERRNPKPETLSLVPDP